MGEAWTVDSFLVDAAVEIPGVHSLGWDFDREWTLVRTAGETEVEDVCPTIARGFAAVGASEGNLGVRDFDADDVPVVTTGVDSVLEAGREVAAILDGDRDADSVLDADRDAEDREVDFDADHGRDMSRRRDADGSFSLCLSLKESLNALKNEDVRACVLSGTVADADFPAECV